MHNKRGFTLIELLVVVAIISLLSSVVLASLNNARRKARDTTRLSDMKAMQTATELYKSSNNGDAPSMSSYPNCFAPLAATYAPYIPKLPMDPLASTACTAENYYIHNTSAAVGTPTIINGDANLANTYAIRFLTEGTTALGTAGYYCLTSEGFHKAGARSGETTSSCNQE